MPVCRYCDRPPVWHARVREQVSEAQITTDVSLCPAHLARVAVSPRLKLLWLRRLLPEGDTEGQGAEPAGQSSPAPPRRPGGTSL